MNKKENVNSGINFNLVNESTERIGTLSGKLLNFISRFIIICSITGGGIFTFTSMMGVKIINWPVYLIIAVSSLIFTSCYTIFKKHWLVFSIGIAAVIIAWLFMLTPVITGFTLIYDNIIESIYQSMYWTAPDPLLSWNDSYISNTTYCISMVAVVLSAASAYFISARIQFIGAFLISFPFFEIGAAFGCIPQKIPFAFLISGWGAALVLHISNRQRNTIKHRNGEKINNFKQYVYKNKNEKFGGSALVMAVSLFLVFLITTNVLTQNGFSRSENLNDLRKNVKETVLNIYDLATGVDHDASLKDGKLYQLADRKVKMRHYATLEMPDVKKDLYLKGFSGSIYTGSSWENLDDNAYKELEEIEQYLKSKEFTLPTITGDLLESDINEKNLKTVKIFLSDFRRKKEYIYTLNGTVSNINMGSYKDLYSTAENNDEYSYTAYYNQEDFVNIPYTSSYQNADFKKQWNSYVNFVQNHYTLLPEGIDDVTRLGQQFKGNTIYELVDIVRGFLAQNTKYSDTVQKLPDGKEFASFFVFEKGVGYSAHYATAAAVMLRALGVPTRYVEGFYIPASQISSGKQNGKNKVVEITDANSHAWVEIFDANYGWIPVEATNGYYDESFAALMKQQQSTASKNQAKNDKKNDSDSGDTAHNNQQNKDNLKPEEQQKIEKEKQKDNDTEKGFKESKLIFYIAIALIILFILLITAVFVFIIRRRITIKKRSNIFNSTDYRKQVILSFELLSKMLIFNKIELNKTYSYTEFRKIIENNFESDSDSSFSITEIFEIYEKAMFSKLLITQSNAQLVVDFLDEFGYNLYTSLTFAKRLKFKYLSILV